MEELKITANELTSLLISSARKGFAQGSKPSGERNMELAIYSVEATVKGLIKTHKLKK